MKNWQSYVTLHHWWERREQLTDSKIKKKLCLKKSNRNWGMLFKVIEQIASFDKQNGLSAPGFCVSVSTLIV